MGSFRDVQPSDTLEIPLLNTVAVRNIRPNLQVPKGPTPFRLPIPLDAVYVLLPLFAFFLWAISLQHVPVQNLNGLGLISGLSPGIITALVILTISFGLALQQPQMKVSILALHLIFVIIILYGTQNLIEEAPRIATVYRHAGYTEYIMRTGTVDPKLDLYFNWPGFFVLSAFVTQVAGYQSVLSYAGWVPVFNNLIYFGPMYMIFNSSTTNKRLVWLGLWFFYLNNWIGQDSYSPQGLNFFLYLVIIAMLLKWFKIPPKAEPHVQRQRRQSRVRFPRLVSRFFDWLGAPDPFYIALQPWQRRALLASLLLVYGLVVFSHPLTPFFALLSVTALVVLRRCRPFWLPIVMAIMTAAWILFMTQAFLVGHLNMVTGTLGDFGANVSSNVTSRAAQGNPQHQFIALLRIIMSAFIWSLAFLGGVRRLRKGYKGTTYVLLAVAPFALIMAQNYGGEMFLRIFLFALPLMAFFAAALFYSKHTLVIRKTSPWMTVAIIAMNLVLLGGFFFTRYGNEDVDYITYAEFDGVQHLYSIAPPHSLLIEAWDASPWQYKDYEKYLSRSLYDDIPDAVIHTNVGEVVRYIESQGNPHTYLIFTRGQKAYGIVYNGLPDDTLDRLENALLASGDFKLIYRNPDAQILLFLGSKTGGRS
ncbi:MAG TPA: hypothetical protein VFN23_00585 [Ktedonobacteraceae bacterium]|nr:hypothetical protein [Ktedonobacteraceae bacterium]